jgi:peptide chain release factor 2
MMQELSALEEEVSSWETLRMHIEELVELFALAEEEEEESLIAEIATEAQEAENELEEMRLALLLAGEHDEKDAILSIHAGAGGTESQDWAEMLLRMYVRWGEQRGYQTEIIDQTPGEEAGLKSVTVGIKGKNAYGYLRSERGVHRLVRISPFDNAHRRHTSFALVEVLPDIGDTVEVELNPNDIEMETFLASGHGGQSVQKNATAVRLRHVPTNTVVACQQERSQIQNRKRAMDLLKSRLYDMQRQQLEEEKERLKGEHVSAGWGNQIRSYVLHPYRMVKDLRTDWQTGNVSTVLDGDLDGLIQAYLRQTVEED